MDEQSSHDVISYVQKTLKDIDYALSKKEKCRVCKDMYDYIIVNKWFLLKNTKFFKTCKSKLQELKYQVTPPFYNLFDVDKYIEIFDNIEKELEVPEKPKKKVKKKFELIIEI